VAPSPLARELAARVNALDPSLVRLGENLDRACTLDLRPKGLTTGYIGRLHAAAVDVLGAPLTMLAALGLFERLKPGAVVLIATGFLNRTFLPVGESDGPPGAATLARLLSLGFGALPVVLVEDEIVPAQVACLRAAGLQVHDPGVSRGIPFGAAVLAFPTEVEAARAEAAHLLRDLAPVAVLATEKLGPNHLGITHSASGMSNEHHPRSRIEHLLDAARAAGLLTIGVGDNGNDFGFAIIEAAVRRWKPYGDVCQCPCGGGLVCTVPTDLLVTASVSNWGVHGIEAALAALLGDPAFFHDRELELRVLETYFRLGAADGADGSYSFGVDGSPAHISGHIVDIMRVMLHQALSRGVRRAF
jgi:hypothetical protein